MFTEKIVCFQDGADSIRASNNKRNVVMFKQALQSGFILHARVENKYLFSDLTEQSNAHTCMHLWHFVGICKFFFVGDVFVHPGVKKINK